MLQNTDINKLITQPVLQSEFYGKSFVVLMGENPKYLERLFIKWEQPPRELNFKHYNRGKGQFQCCRFRN